MSWPHAGCKTLSELTFTSPSLFPSLQNGDLRTLTTLREDDGSSSVTPYLVEQSAWCMVNPQNKLGENLNSKISRHQSHAQHPMH